MDPVLTGALIGAGTAVAVNIVSSVVNFQLTKKRDERLAEAESNRILVRQQVELQDKIGEVYDEFLRWKSIEVSRDVVAWVRRLAPEEAGEGDTVAAAEALRLLDEPTERASVAYHKILRLDSNPIQGVHELHAMNSAVYLEGAMELAVELAKGPHIDPAIIELADAVKPIREKIRELAREAGSRYRA